MKSNLDFLIAAQTEFIKSILAADKKGRSGDYIYGEADDCIYFGTPHWIIKAEKRFSALPALTVHTIAPRGYRFIENCDRLFAGRAQADKPLHMTGTTLDDPAQKIKLRVFAGPDNLRVHINDKFLKHIGAADFCTAGEKNAVYADCGLYEAVIMPVLCRPAEVAAKTA